MHRLNVILDGVSYQVELGDLPVNGGPVTVSVNGIAMQVTLPAATAQRAGASAAGEAGIEWALVDQRPYELQVDRDLRWMRSRLGLSQVEIRDLAVSSPRLLSGDGRVKAPIPGQIRAVMVAAGQPVSAGQPLMVLEAMKMENEIRAPRAGVVKEVYVQAGEGVPLHKVLAEIV